MIGSCSVGLIVSCGFTMIYLSLSHLILDVESSIKAGRAYFLSSCCWLSSCLDLLDYFIFFLVVQFVTHQIQRSLANFLSYGQFSSSGADLEGLLVELEAFKNTGRHFSSKIRRCDLSSYQILLAHWHKRMTLGL